MSDQPAVHIHPTSQQEVKEWFDDHVETMGFRPGALVIWKYFESHQQPFDREATTKILFRYARKVKKPELDGLAETLDELENLHTGGSGRLPCEDCSGRQVHCEHTFTQKTCPACKEVRYHRSGQGMHLDERVKQQRKGKPIFSGDDSVDMWKEINGARTIKDLRRAVYGLGCKLQEFESRVDQRESDRRTP